MTITYTFISQQTQFTKYTPKVRIDNSNFNLVFNKSSCSLGIPYLSISQQKLTNSQLLVSILKSPQIYIKPKPRTLEDKHSIRQPTCHLTCSATQATNSCKNPQQVAVSLITRIILKSIGKTITYQTQPSTYLFYQDVRSVGIYPGSPGQQLRVRVGPIADITLPSTQQIHSNSGINALIPQLFNTTILYNI